MRIRFVILLLALTLSPVSLLIASDTDVLRTPALDALKQRMEYRLIELEPYHMSGAIGLSSDGFLVVRNAEKLPLDKRARVKRLISKENRDREAMLQAMDLMIPHMTKTELRERQMPQWRQLMPVGSWIQNSGKWQQKS